MPDTLNYMIAGYVVAFVLLGITIGSIVWRYRAFAKTEALLDLVEASDHPSVASTGSPASTSATNAVPSR